VGGRESGDGAGLVLVQNLESRVETAVVHKEEWRTMDSSMRKEHFLDP